MRGRWIFVVACLPSATFAACGSSTPSQSSASDAGRLPDATTASDSGEASGPDAGESSVGDAGDAGDAGTVTSRLTVGGTRMLGPDGGEILLRGWNWGEWGSAQPQDGRDNVSQGANIVRIPLRWWGDYGSEIVGNLPVDSRIDSAPYIDPEHLAELDSAIQEAAAAGLWIDLFVDSDCGQDSPSNDGGYCGSVDGSPATFVNDAQRLAQFTAVWSYLATKYKDQPFLGMYEILPEPSFGCKGQNGCADYSLAPAFYAPIIASIRAIDPVTPILVGANGGYSVEKIATAWIDAGNLVYTADFLHDYAQKPDTLSYVTAFRAEAGVPIFIQQVGVEKADDDGGGAAPAAVILDDLNADDIGWTWWTYREQFGAQEDGGSGYAPYYGGASGAYALDEQWLDLISARMR